MIKRYLYILLIFSTACGSKADKVESDFFLGQKTSYKASELAVVSTRTVRKLNDELHGVSFMTTTGQLVSKDTLSLLLYNISGLDLINKDTYETYVRECNNVEILTWKSIGHKNVVTKIQKINLKTSIPLSDGGENILIITDFDVYSVTNPKHVALRVIDNQDLEYLKVDEIEYSRVAESITVGLNIASAKVDSAKGNACR